MTIKYLTSAPDRDGWYLLKVDGALVVAERCMEHWLITGIDYDAWLYSTDEFEIAVICMLDLGQIATGVEAAADENQYRIAVIFDIANGFQNTPLQWFAETIKNRMADSVGLNGKAFEIVDLRAKK